MMFNAENAPGGIMVYYADGDEEIVPTIEKQLYDLAVLSHKPLTQEEMTAFVKRSNEIMLMLTK